MIVLVSKYTHLGIGLTSYASISRAFLSTRLKQRDTFFSGRIWSLPNVWKLKYACCVIMWVLKPAKPCFQIKHTTVWGLACFQGTHKKWRPSRSDLISIICSTAPGTCGFAILPFMLQIPYSTWKICMLCNWPIGSYEAAVCVEVAWVWWRTKSEPLTEISA